MRILEFESPDFVEYKNRYDFLKFDVLLKPLFSIGAGIRSKLQNFVLDCKTLEFVKSYMASKMEMLMMVVID